MKTQYRGKIVRHFISSISIAVSTIILLHSNTAMACATCGCTLSTDAATGFSTQAGWRVNIQYDYVKQDQLRHGTGTASGVPIGNELEDETTNHYFTTTFSYAPNSSWGVSVILPYILRDHTTLGEFNPPTPTEKTGSKTSSLGDIKVVGNYQGFLPTHNLGILFGVKLPSGQSGDDIHFDSGAEAGAPLDTSLHPGTGSTDVILGAYYYQALSQDYDGFATINYQVAVKTQFDFRPGNQTNISIGTRYVSAGDWVPQLQLNIADRRRDSGDSSDADNSAGTFIHLSPGVTVLASKQTQYYGFLQVPLYQNLEGWQLAPRWTATLGFAHTF